MNKFFDNNKSYFYLGLLILLVLAVLEILDRVQHVEKHIVEIAMFERESFLFRENLTAKFKNKQEQKEDGIIDETKKEN